VTRLKGRLAKLEARWAAPPQPAEPQVDERRVDLYLALLATMSERHLALVLEAWEYGRQGQRHPDKRVERLREIVDGLVLYAYRGEDHFQLALPEPIADAFMEPNIGPYDRCEDCHLAIPYNGEYWQGKEHHPAWHGFTWCPVCGGRVRYYDYGRWVHNEEHRRLKDPLLD
jgi:hypothetical protein